MLIKRTVPLVVTVLACLLLAGTVMAGSSANYRIAWDALTGGGGVSTSGSYMLRGSIVTTAIGVTGDGTYVIQGGFWPGLLSEPGTSVVVPLVLRGS